ncbi:MAG: hypothetical protein ACRDK0_12650, partial [Solirubrobacteraceae bacterium]
LGEPPAAAADDREALTYVLNPRLGMSSGKVAAQAAHAAVIAAGLTEVPPGTVTVVALPPARPDALTAALRDDRTGT